jgi:acetyltransferase-like isoleucine patch superfamily enzyme
MIKNILIFFHFYEKAVFLKKVGFGKLLLNFLCQRVLRINSQVKASVSFTSTFIGNKLFFYERDINTLVSFASSGSLYIQALNGVYLGKNVLIASGVKIVSANHSLDKDRSSIPCAPIKIGDNVWIGANAIILPGVSIGSNCTIGAGSVVSKSFLGEGLVIAGNPAKIIKNLS